MKESIRAVWKLLEGERLRYAGAIASLVVASCLLYVVPMVPQIVLDGALARPDNGPADSVIVRIGLRLFGGEDFLRNHLWVAAAAMAMVSVLSGLFTFFRSRLSATAAENIAVRLRDNLYDHIQHLPATFFEQRETGDLIQRCTSDVETFRVFLSVQIVEIGRALIMLLIPIPLMFLTNTTMTLASLVLVPPIVAFSAVFFVKVRRSFRLKDEAEGRLTARVQENLTGIRVVKAFHRQEYEEDLFDQRNRDHRDLDFRLYRLFAGFWSLSDLLCFAQKAIVVIIGINLIARGEMTVGAFFFFLSAVALFIWPVRMMGRLLSELGKAMVAVNRIDEILGAEPEPDPEEPVSPALEGNIEFNEVTFSHGENSPVLQQVSFQIKSGRTVAILGPSGSGKSTLINLLLRLYDPDEGTILLDGHEVRTMTREHVRSHISVVMQEPFLYSRNLRENIAIARTGTTEQEIVEAASVAAIHDNIERFERGYDTLIGERGVTLSGGQRQRVAIARALMEEPAILILDDALSAIDTETESRILGSLEKKGEAKHTTIIIAHRLSTVMNADEIIVLDKGRVAQQGDHDALLKQTGIYRRLWEIQEERVGESTIE